MGRKSTSPRRDLPSKHFLTTRALPILMAAYPPTTTTRTIARTETEDIQTEMVMAIVGRTEEEEIQMEVVAAIVGS
jgi:hypothetical protein